MGIISFYVLYWFICRLLCDPNSPLTLHCGSVLFVDVGDGFIGCKHIVIILMYKKFLNTIGAVMIVDEFDDEFSCLDKYFSCYTVVITKHYSFSLMLLLLVCDIYVYLVICFRQFCWRVI